MPTNFEGSTRGPSEEDEREQTEDREEKNEQDQEFEEDDIEEDVDMEEEEQGPNDFDPRYPEENFEVDDNLGNRVFSTAAPPIPTEYNIHHYIKIFLTWYNLPQSFWPLIAFFLVGGIARANLNDNGKSTFAKKH